MDDEIADKQRLSIGRGWRILGWVLLGGVIGGVMVAAFIAYGQPELLLEQMNLRYCG